MSLWLVGATGLGGLLPRCLHERRKARGYVGYGQVGGADLLQDRSKQISADVLAAGGGLSSQCRHVAANGGPRHNKTLVQLAFAGPFTRSRTR